MMVVVVVLEVRVGLLVKVRVEGNTSCCVSHVSVVRMRKLKLVVVVEVKQEQRSTKGAESRTVGSAESR